MNTLQQLLVYPEVRALRYLATILLLVIILFLVLTFVLHTAWVIFGKSAMYKRRQPVPGWNKRFYPASLALLIIVILLIWLINWA